ncbi:NEAT domain-containing protein [Lysinibacillus sp. NPDC096418]|uniref:NEAT domain-containing protein n=1 Tax=Lysinibacillus sp. NPDC096418 TaxID=3364138 RepID=UPI0038035E55
MTFPSQFVWKNAWADEGLAKEDGQYQVELSFPLVEGEQQDSFFSKAATLFVKNGHYQLSLPMVYPDIITNIQIMQLEKIVPSTLNKAENLVQFDMNDLTQPFTINGAVILPFEEETVSFMEQLAINVDSLKFIGPVIEEKPPVNSEETDEEQPTKEWSFDYVLLEDGENEPSMMNTYVNPTAKIIELDDKYFAQMTILKSRWVTGLTVEQQGEQMEPTLISLVDDIRVVQFEVNDFEKLQRLWIKLDIPELTYHHEYFVDLQFDKEQVANFLGKSLEQIKPEQPKKEDVSNVQDNVGVKAPDKDLSAIPLKPPTIKVFNPLLGETQLAFDRTLDEDVEEATEDTQREEVTEDTTGNKEIANDTAQQLAQLDKIKIVLLIVICLLSGIMLIRRLKNAKQK